MRLIDAEEFETAIKKYTKYNDCIDSDFYFIKVKRVFEIIEEAPTIEAKPVVHAHWINYNDMFPCQCSNCSGFALSFDIGNYQKEIESDFCPHCGAQMDENNTQKVSVDGVKIPVISMEDVPKLAKEMEK